MKPIIRKVYRVWFYKGRHEDIMSDPNFDDHWGQEYFRNKKAAERYAKSLDKTWYSEMLDYTWAYKQGHIGINMITV